MKLKKWCELTKSQKREAVREILERGVQGVLQPVVATLGSHANQLEFYEMLLAEFEADIESVKVLVEDKEEASKGEPAGEVLFDAGVLD